MQVRWYLSWVSARPLRYLCQHCCGSLAIYVAIAAKSQASQRSEVWPSSGREPRTAINHVPVHVDLDRSNWTFHIYICIVDLATIIVLATCRVELLGLSGVRSYRGKSRCHGPCRFIHIQAIPSQVFSAGQVVHRPVPSQMTNRVSGARFRADLGDD